MLFTFFWRTGQLFTWDVAYLHSIMHSAFQNGTLNLDMIGPSHVVMQMITYGANIIDSTKEKKDKKAGEFICVVILNLSVTHKLVLHYNGIHNDALSIVHITNFFFLK